MATTQTQTPDEVVQQQSPTPEPKVTNTNWAGRVSGILTISAGVIAIVVSILSSVLTHESSNLSAAAQYASLYSKILGLESDFAAKNQEINSRIKSIEEHILSMANIPKDNALSLELQKVTTSVNDLNTRESKIEAVILENPAKALETPLLRRDLDNVRESQKEALVSLKDSVDRIYDLNKWLLGAMAVSIVTLAAGNFLKSETKPPPASGSPPA